VETHTNGRERTAGGGETGAVAGAWRLGWWLFGVWSAVGTVVVVGGLRVPGGGWSDFVFLLLGANVVGLAGVSAWGARRTLAALAWVALGSGLIETIGTLTGWPFGSYSYTAALGPRLGVLPLAIPLAWWVVLVPLWVLAAGRWGGIGLSDRLLRIGSVAVAAVLVDLVLEPVAWQLRGYWLWADGGPWYGVPLQNFVGWAGTAAVLTAGLEWGLARRGPEVGGVRLRRTAWVLALVVGIFGLALLRHGPTYVLPGSLGVGLAAALAWGGCNGTRRLPRTGS